MSFATRANSKGDATHNDITMDNLGSYNSSIHNNYLTNTQKSTKKVILASSNENIGKQISKSKRHIKPNIKNNSVI